MYKTYFCIRIINQLFQRINALGMKKRLGEKVIFSEKISQTDKTNLKKGWQLSFKNAIL